MTSSVSRPNSKTEAEARLQAWLDDIVLGRMHVPHYANPGELKADIRTVLAALASRAEQAEAEPHVYCVSRASDGTPLSTVKLLGDAEAVEAVAREVARAEQLEAPAGAAPILLNDALELQKRAEAAEARVAALEAALREIAETAGWYARNGDRLPLEVDHALCVEVLSLAETALAAVSDRTEETAT